MILYIHPIQVNPTEEQIRSLRTIILDSLENDATTWIKLRRSINISDNVTLPLFTHIREQYQNEPFYFRITSESVVLKFEINHDEGSKSMIIGMLVYYLRYHLSDNISKIEVK